MTQRDGMGREVGEGFRIGDTCTPVADSCWCMAKSIQYCKVKKIKTTTTKKNFLLYKVIVRIKIIYYKYMALCIMESFHKSSLLSFSSVQSLSPV